MTSRNTGQEHDWSNSSENISARIPSASGGGHPQVHNMGSHSDRHKGTSIASASAITVPTDGDYCTVTGTTPIATIATRDAGDRILLRCISGGLVFTHLTGTLNMRGKVDLTTEDGTIVEFVSEGSGEWTEIRRAGSVDGLLVGFEAAALAYLTDTIAVAAAKVEVSGQSFAGTLAYTVETITVLAEDTT